MIRVCLYMDSCDFAVSVRLISRGVCALLYRQDKLRVCDFYTQELYGDLYTEKNVALSGIHTHSGPGGYLQYILYIITSLGFVRESFDVLVAGIVQVTHACQP